MRKFNRREFAAAGGALAGSTAFIVSATPEDSRELTARQVKDYLWSLNGGWVNLAETVDTFKAGRPETVVRGIAVGWMSYSWALEEALARGCNLFVTHEPTYYDHLDRDGRVFRFAAVQKKKDFIEESHLVILRCHDVWDQYPEIGIPDAWAKALGFSDAVVTDGFYRVFELPEAPVRELARQVAIRTKPMGQDSVQLIGPPDLLVSRAVIGCGAITPFQHFLDKYQPDVAICTDDGFTYWRDGALAIDLGKPVILVNHAVAEEFGVKLLAEKLRERFPGTPVHHIAQKCMYRTINA